MSVWPTPHEPHRTPWQPDLHPPPPLPSTPSQSHLVDSRPDWLGEAEAVPPGLAVRAPHTRPVTRSCTTPSSTKLSRGGPAMATA